MLNRAIAPPSKPISHIHVPQMQSITLKNGHKLHFFEAKNAEVLRLELFWNAGVIYENIPSLANFTAKMLTEGTSKYSASHIISQIDQYGAFIETNAGLERISITIYTLTRHLEKVLEWVNETINDSVFPENEWENLRQISRQNLRINQQKNSHQASNYFKKYIFGEKNPFGQFLTEEYLDFLQHPHLKDFFNTKIKNQPIEGILVGNFAENTLQITQNFLENIQTSTPNIRPVLAFEKPIPTRQDFPKEGSLQSSIRLGEMLFSKKHEDYSKIMVLNEVFGGYFGARLMKNIREEKGYTYGIYSQYVALRDTGYWAISADVKKEFLENTFQEIDHEANVLKQDVLSDKELETVKNYMLGAFAGSLNTAFDVGEVFKAIYFSGLGYDFYPKYLDIIRHITAQEICETAQKYLHTDTWGKISVG